MPVTSINDNYKTSCTIWMEADGAIIESAIVIERTEGGLNLSQNGQNIYIDETCVDGFCKAMKNMAKKKA